MNRDEMKEWVKRETDQMDETVDNYVKLKRLEIEQKRYELEERRAKEQAKKDRIDMILKHVINVGTAGVTAGITWKAFKLGLKFEEEGSFTTTTMRNFMNKNMFKFK